MGRDMLSKSLIQFFVDGQGCVPCLLFDLRPNYGGGNEDNVYLFQKFPWHISAFSVPDLSASHCWITPPWRLLDTHRKVWVSLLWCHCSFPLGSGVHEVLFVPSKSVFHQSYISSVIKSYWPTKSKSLGVLSPFSRPPGWEICCGS